jgi:hypothetical protein
MQRPSLTSWWPPGSWRAGVPERKKGSGKLRKVTRNVLKSLKRQVSNYPYMTPGQLRATVPDVANLFDRSVQHALQEDVKIPSRVAALKPMSAMKMKKKRLILCRKYKHWITVYWEKVMYSDELTFRVNRAMWTLLPRPISSNQYSRQFIVRPVKHPNSVMVWGPFSAAGCGGLYFLPRNPTMNAERECATGSPPPLHGVPLQYPFPPRSTCHASKRIKNFLADKPFEVIEWPGNSKVCFNTHRCTQ